MPDALDPIKAKALELANQHGGSHEEIVTKATAFHSFLTGTAVDVNAVARPAKPVAAADPSAGGGGGVAKPGTVKPTTASGTVRPAAASGAVKPGAVRSVATKSSVVPAGDTKAAGGKYTFDDVLQALRSVAFEPVKSGDPDANKKLARSILTEAGGGATTAKDLKPAMYDAVVTACQVALKNLKTAPAVPDTSGASGKVDPLGDPPEGGSGDDAEDDTMTDL